MKKMEQINAGNSSLRRSKIKESRLESNAMNKQRHAREALNMIQEHNKIKKEIMDEE